MSDKDKDSNLQYMNKITYNLPNYIKKNLKNMPNNKGYIYKNVWFFGEKNRTHNTQIMFEKINRNILRIYKITDNYIIIIEKDQITNESKLVSKEKRNKI